MTQIWGIDVPLPPGVAWSALAAGLVIGAWIGSRALRALIERSASHTRFEEDDALAAGLGPYLLPAALLLAAAIFASAAHLPARAAGLLDQGLRLGITILLVAAGGRLGLTLLRRAMWRNERLAPVASPILRVARIALVSLGVLIVLDTAGIRLGPVLATLGVGSVAVALALQPSLSNFFAGLYLLADRPLAPGDYIKLESGEEGTVVRVGWRSTRIRKLQNNMVIVPNEKLAGSIITNYAQPETRMALLIPVSVSYGSDTRQVEALLVRIAQQSARDIPGLLAEPEPFVRFIPGFGESSLDFTLIVQVRQFVDQYMVQHELRHRIFEAFRKESIEIPFPQRAVHLSRRVPSRG